MVISLDIDRFTIRKTLVDQGSSVDILYWKTFKAMRIPEAEMACSRFLERKGGY